VTGRIAEEPFIGCRVYTVLLTTAVDNVQYVFETVKRITE